MKQLLVNMAVILFALANAMFGTALGIYCIFSSLNVVLFNTWLAIKILALATLALIGHLYIIYNLLKFTTGFD